MRAVTTLPAKPEFPKHVARAITELQSRVWRLRNLIQCVRETDTEMVDDFEAAMSGLVEYADDIYHEMDAALVAQQAHVLKAAAEARPRGGPGAG